MEAIQVSMDTMMVMLQEKLSKLENEMKNASTSGLSNPSAASELSSFKVFVLQAFANVKQQIELLAQNVDRLDMYSRRKILLFHGITENNKEDTINTVVKVIQDKLKLPDFTAANIRRCHRMGRTQDAQKQRPILVKFNDMTVRNRIWFAKTSLKGSGVTVSEFLTRRRHQIFTSAREKFGISKCWTRDGFVYVLGRDGTRHRVDALDVLNKISLEISQEPDEPLKKANTKPKRQGATKK